MPENSSPPQIVITGLAPIAACGIGKDAFWSVLQMGRSGIGELTRFEPAEGRARCAGEVRDFDPTAFFPPHRMKRLDRHSQFAVAAARLALEDAGLAWSKAAPNDRIGVAFGTALGGIADAEHEHARFLKKGPRAVNPALALQIFGGAAHANIALECGFRGPANTHSNSCASGIVALGDALATLRAGRADVMLAGAAEAPLCPLTWHAFDQIKTMSRWAGAPALACRPFDTARDGFVMGEGAACLVLETRAHAERRGARAYAEVCGYALNNDAHHMTTPLPGGETLRAVMRTALADGGVAPDEVDYVNAHASATPANDGNEATAIRDVFGSHLAISGTKPFHAHPLGATGALEAIVCALALREQWVPPTLHLENPDPSCAGLDLVPKTGRPARLRAAVCNAFGFGGANASLVLRAV
jgi:3-oxoacyl-[acyl-carrier-protein] synthase II